MAVVTPTSGSKSVRIRPVIEVFGGVLILPRFFLGCFHTNESNLFLFLCDMFIDFTSTLGVHICLWFKCVTFECTAAEGSGMLGP